MEKEVVEVLLNRIVIVETKGNLEVEEIVIAKVDKIGK
mgnify:CR=1 FL=1